ncbi:MAG: shikimate dehydrogenase [Ignavibacteriota bacterium]|nr:MAG: shikimate dehydrogenase [Chlorobiota bacterium]MBE7477469.1 shikimate dehydrogenase [Ignavibacteriales bacterium]MBL1124016.1 shikimate dehydrogenase [Ignavibacteriota bacterium]MCC7095149.1 shikimate dehydrogenase [Ignavibacteriaceae bacterium]MCE7857778.1 shikimate dehydrogenase [Ignavibacteria bacterium CHB3]MEB2297484.1 shikimate dehydrogenase [Ignavibacteria bacterium]
MRDSFLANTELIGLIGHPIKHSYSPFIQNFALEQMNLDYVYLPFDVPSENLKAAVNGVLALGLKGLNVTLPHKEKIIKFLDEVSEEASIIGAVNTIVNDHGKLMGYNTDAFGILETLLPFKEKISGAKATVIGAGGSARAVIYTLLRYFKPEEINIINRTQQKADTLANDFSLKMRYDLFHTFELFPPDNVDTLRDSKLIVNATTIGMYPEIEDTITDIDDSFNEDQIVFDLIYNPTKTKFLKTAEMQGAKVVGGLKMLIAQAAKSFKLWTGLDMPVEVIADSLQEYIKQQNV